MALIQESLSVAHKTGAIASKNLERVAVDEEAYDLFLRGREQAWLHTKSGNVEARNLLGRAFERRVVGLRKANISA